MEKENLYYIGIDIGSTASKTVILDKKTVVDAFTLPTGWNGRETAQGIYKTLSEKGYATSMRCVATGYGRICVDYADKIVTEITSETQIIPEPIVPTEPETIPAPETVTSAETVPESEVISEPQTAPQAEPEPQIPVPDLPPAADRIFRWDAGAV